LSPLLMRRARALRRRKQLRGLACMASLRPSGPRSIMVWHIWATATLGSLVAGKAFGAAGEVEGEFVSDFAFVKALLVSEPVAVAAEFFPGGDVLGGETIQIFDFGFWIFD